MERYHCGKVGSDPTFPASLFSFELLRGPVARTCLGQLLLRAGDIGFFRCAFERVLSLFLGGQRRRLIELLATQGRIRKYGYSVWLHLEHAARDVKEMLVALGILNTHFARLQRRQQGCVPGRYSHFAHFRGREHHDRITGVNLAFCRYDVDFNRGHELVLLLEVLRVLDRFVDRANHVERLLGNVVVVAIDDAVEAANRLSKRNILAGRVREDFSNEERL